VKRCVGPFAATPIESPTAKCSFFAVSGSITTSPGRSAHRPASSFSGLNRGWAGSMPKPNVGEPELSIAFPSRPISFARVESPFRSMIAPAAAETPGCDSIFSSSACDTVAFPLEE